jgi:hypothetical protein
LKQKQTIMKKVLLFIVSILLTITASYSQCGFLNKQENGNNYYPRTTNQSVGIGDAAFLRFPIKSGNGTSYHFETCGTSYDTQLTGYNGAATGTSLFYNDDACSTQSIVDWTGTFDGTLIVQNSRYNCQNWTNSGSATLTYRCSPPTSPSQGTAGNGAWNVFCYAAGDASGGSGAWSSNYSGVYTDASVNFNTGTYWGNTPYDASTYNGCYIGNDNHSWRAIRTGWSCAVYQINVNGHDDRAQMYINGGLVWDHNGCCDNHNNVWTGVLASSDVVEFRASEGGGGSNGSISLVNVTSGLSGGSISFGGVTTACNGYNPPAFGNTSAASGGSSASVNNGSTTYQWQLNAGNISGATGTTYDPPALSPGTYTYRRRVTDKCGSLAYSNSYTFTVTADPTASISGGGATTGCSGLDPTTLTGSVNDASGTDSYQWTVNNTNLSGGTGTTYNPGTLPAGTWTFRLVHSASGSNCDPATSSPITFTVVADPTVSIAGGGTSSGCAGLDPTTLTASPVGGIGTSSYQWTLNDGNIAGATASTYNPPALSAGTYDYAVVYYMTGSGCNTAVSSAITFTVSADPAQPTATMSPTTATVCEGQTLSLTGVSAISGGSGTCNILYSINGGTFATSPTSVTASLGTNTIRIRTSCTGAACDLSAISTYTWTVNADPIITISGGSSPLCEGSSPGTFTSSVSGGIGAFTYQWEQRFNGGGWGNLGTLFNQAIGVLTAPGTYEYQCTVADAGAACNGDVSNIITIVIEEDPSITAFPGVCDDATTSITTSAGAISVSAGSYSGTTFTPPNLTPPTQNQMVTITATNGSCVTNQLIQVDNKPTFTSSGAAMCEGQTRTLTSDVTGTTFSGTGVSGGVFTAPDPGGTSAIYFISASNGSCSSLQAINVYGAVSITSSNDAMCEGSLRTFTTTGTGGTWQVNGAPVGFNFTAPTPAGGLSSETFLISYVVAGSPCSPTQNITVYANPSTSDAGDNFDACVGVPTTLNAVDPAKGIGTWTWSIAPDSYAGGTNANDYNAQVVFNTPGLHTGTWTSSNVPCTSDADVMTLDVFSIANNAYLVSGATSSSVEGCDESAWTYYANPAKPDEYVFGIRKNGNTFMAEVTITDLPGNATYSSTGGAGPDRGTWLIGRYWNVEMASGSISTTVDIRFFLDAGEITQAQNEANAFLNTTDFASNISPFTFFKTTGSTFDPVTGMALGDFTFAPTYLPYTAGSIGGVTYFEMTGLTSFSGGSGGFSVNDDGSTLPVELLSFDANALDDSFIQLDWATATEINNDGFELMRSADGVNFERIAWIEGNGNSTEINEYSYDDHSVGKGFTYYYQLKQVDYDGQSELFDVVSASIRGKNDFFIGNVVPNPSKDNSMVTVDMQSSSEELVSVQIYNHVGMQVASFNKEVNPGENVFKLDVRELAAGTYFMNFESSLGVEMRKLVIIK